MSDIPATIDLNPSGQHPEASVIWMHGLGADASDFVPIVEQFIEHYGILQDSKVRFVFPQAPIRPITVNNGMRMRAWYDIAALNLVEKEDELGIKESSQLIHTLIERESDLGIPSHKIVLAGFSQGGAMALYSGLRYPTPLAGIVALSCYLPLPEVFHQERHLANERISIFMAHGLFDPVVPLMLGQRTKTQLEKLGHPIEWHTYGMSHTVIPEEIEDIGKFLNRVIQAIHES